MVMMMVARMMVARMMVMVMITKAWWREAVDSV